MYKTSQERKMGMCSRMNCIQTIYKKNNRWVYKGLCNGKPTKWIVFSEDWDFKINLKYDTSDRESGTRPHSYAVGEILYTDTLGREIQVWEDDEEEYFLW